MRSFAHYCLIPLVWLALSVAFASCIGFSSHSSERGSWVCEDCFRQDSIVLQVCHRSDTLHMVQLSANGTLHDSLLLPYPVYRVDCGDLTGDGLPELVVGVIKAARYWPTPQKRLFIYHLYRGHYIRPLWLGSRVGNPLYDFRIDRDSLPAQVCTQEWDSDSTLIHRRYQMGGFGLKLRKNN